MNRAVLPQDPALPQLATALDAACMAQAFAGLLQAPGRSTLQQCRIERIKYRPGRNLAVSYLLDLQDDVGPYTQRVAARFCSGGASERRHASALQRPVQATRGGPALSHLAALDMAAHWWPNDAKLAAGVVLADDHALRARWLPPVLQAAGGGRCVDHRVTLVQVVPEHRVTARLALDRQDDGGQPQPALAVYAKADAEGRGAVTQAVMQSLWHSPARRAGRLLVPQPLLWQPGSGLQWQLAVPGRPLLDAWPQPGPDQAAAVGALVASLHATPAPAAPLQTLHALRQRLQLVLVLLCQVQPALQPRLLRLADLLAQGLDAAAAGPISTLHGDLHPRNLLVDGERLTLIDLDSAHRGPALLELGAWLADALYRAQLDGHDATATAAACQAFLAGHRAGGGAAFAARHVAWATAWQLLCQRIWRCVVNLKPGRYALLPGLLAAAQALLVQPEVEPVAALAQGAGA